MWEPPWALCASSANLGRHGQSIGLMLARFRFAAWEVYRFRLEGLRRLHKGESK